MILPRVLGTAIVSTVLLGGLSLAPANGGDSQDLAGSKIQQLIDNLITTKETTLGPI